MTLPPAARPTTANGHVGAPGALLTTRESIDAATRFSPARRTGYTQSEVDAFVAAVRGTVEVLTHDLHAAENARRDLEGRLSDTTPGAGPDGGGPVHVRAARLLEIAQRTADAAIAEARESAEQLLAQARDRAAALEAAARGEAEALERAARERRDRLQAEVDLLEASRADARTHVRKLTALLADVLDRTDATPDEEPDEEEATVSIYEQLGREHGIGAAVEAFYERVVADPQLAPYFTGTDMATLRRHQTALLVQVTGGPVQYEGRDLALAHAGLGITGADFDRVVGHLAGTLTDLGVDTAVVGQVGAALGSHRGEIVQSPVPVD